MQLTIRIPDEQMEKIDYIAKEMGLKKSDVTRMAVKKFLEEYKDTKEKPYTRVKHLLGVASSGLPDLGQNHRNYLIRKIKKEDK